MKGQETKAPTEPTPPPPPPPPRPRPPVAAKPHENWKEIAKIEFRKKVKQAIRKALLYAGEKKEKIMVDEIIENTKPPPDKHDWSIPPPQVQKIKNELKEKWDTLPDKKARTDWLDTRYDNQYYGESYRKANILVSHPEANANINARNTSLIALKKWKENKRNWVKKLGRGDSDDMTALKKFIIEHSTDDPYSDDLKNNFGQLRAMARNIINNKKHFLWKMKDGDSFSGLGNERQELQKKWDLVMYEQTMPTIKLWG